MISRTRANCLRIALALVPAILFLVALRALDSYKGPKERGTNFPTIPLPLEGQVAGATADD
jgi:hypothetical protein